MERSIYTLPEEQMKKTREYMERMKKTGKEYNPAPKEPKNGKVQK